MKTDINALQEKVITRTHLFHTFHIIAVTSVSKCGVQTSVNKPIHHLILLMHVCMRVHLCVYLGVCVWVCLHVFLGGNDAEQRQDPGEQYH